jgi:hypothetical protein
MFPDILSSEKNTKHWSKAMQNTWSLHSEGESDKWNASIALSAMSVVCKYSDSNMR